MSKVDKNLCIACGICFGTHPDLFALGADGKAEAIKQPETPEEKANSEDAKNSCPVGAISE